MPKLSHTLHAWNSDRFSQTLHDEIRNLGTGALPLYKGTAQGGIVDDSDLSVSVISTSENDNSIKATIGVFFSEIVGGCSCGDEPIAVNAYCEFQVIIDKSTAEADISVIQN